MLRIAGWVSALALVVAGAGTVSADRTHGGKRQARTDKADESRNRPARTPAPSPEGLDAEPTPAPRRGDGVATLALDPTRWNVGEGRTAIPKVDGVPLDQTYPALAGWIHPVADATELVPTRWQRKFDARRGGGGSRPGCGRGRHCGLDLAGPRGRTIVAVTAGTVVHIEKRRNGKDGFSGRYVKLEHPGGVFTAYMHLDSIAPKLAIGDQVAAGQFIGRLGKTGIRHGEPHLHFNLELPTGKKSTKYLDATPFLQRARVIPDPVPHREDNSAKS